jgi:hypothetical protein
MNKLLVLLLPAAALLASCSKNNVQPAPAAELSFSRSFDYTGTGVQRDTAYAPEALQSHAHTDVHGLILSVQPHSSREYLNFRIKREQMPATLIGTHSLDDTGIVDTYYLYRFPNTRTGAVGNSVSNEYASTRGTLTITSYDPTANLLSGSYEVHFADVTDPTDTSTNPSQVRRCNVKLAGSFRNVKVLQP